MKKLLLFVLTIYTFTAQATHSRGGHISVQRVSSLTCRITVTFYTDLGSPAEVGGEGTILNFGDGTTATVPYLNTESVNGYPNVGKAIFTILHTFPGNSSFTISFLEPNRNEGVINMDNSVFTPFYVETKINLDPILGFSSTPEFVMEPIFRAALGQELNFSSGAISTQDNSIYYKLGTPYSDRLTPVQNYQRPENISINPYNGVINWDTQFHEQYIAGEFSFNVKATAYKEIDGVFYAVCTVSRDLQIITEDSNDALLITTNATVDENGRLYIPSGQTKTVKVFFHRFPLPTVTAASELSEEESAYSFTSYDSSTNQGIRVGVLTLTSQPAINRENHYLITLRGQWGQFGSMAKDFQFMLFTQDVEPKLKDFVEAVLGAEADLLKHTEAYPNPFENFFKISLPDNVEAQITVRDGSGKVVLHTTSIGSTTLDLRDARRGFYFCTVRTQSGIKQLKLVKH